MIALKDGISFARAARDYLPAGDDGRPYSIATLTRWALKGVKGPGGKLVKLEAVKVGSRWLTSPAALQTFAEALGQTRPAEDDRPTPTAERRIAERAGREALALGL